jgi:hypothetical protein
MVLSTRGDDSLRSIVGIPSGKEILDAGGEGLPCRGGVFNVVRVDVVGIPNDADFSVFSESLLKDLLRTAKYQKLIESASKSGKMMRLANLTANSDKRSCGKVLLTINRKTRVLQTVSELKLLNKEDMVINLPMKRNESLQVAIYNAQLNNPTLGLVVKSAFVFSKRISSTSTQHTL